MKEVFMLWIWSLEDEVRMHTRSNLFGVYDEEELAMERAESMGDRLSRMEPLDWKVMDSGLGKEATNRHFRYVVSGHWVLSRKLISSEEEQRVYKLRDEKGYEEAKRIIEQAQADRAKRLAQREESRKLEEAVDKFVKAQAGGVQDATPVTPPNPPSNPTKPSPPAVPVSGKAWVPDAI